MIKEENFFTKYLKRFTPEIKIDADTWKYYLSRKITFHRGSSQLRDQPCVFCIGRWMLYYCTTWEALELTVSIFMILFKVAESCGLSSRY